MPYTLNDRNIAELLSALCGSYEVVLACGKVRLLARRLPGNAVCVILPEAPDGILRLVYDTAKPDCFGQTQALVRDWWESFAEPEVFPDGTVEMLRRVCPEVPEGPVQIAVMT